MQCRKVGYLTKREAKVAKKQCQDARAAGYAWRDEDRIYRCHCGSWHLTSTPVEELDGAVGA